MVLEIQEKYNTFRVKWQVNSQGSKHKLFVCVENISNMALHMLMPTKKIRDKKRHILYKGIEVNNRNSFNKGDVPDGKYYRFREIQVGYGCRDIQT